MQMTPSERLDATFIALADPTRRAILARLKDGDATVNELAAPFDISQPAVSKHLKILERAGLVTRTNVGTSRPVTIEAGPMRDAVDWLEKYREFWEKSYQRLDALLEILQTPLNTDKPKTKAPKTQRKDDDA
jgi:DNA-binding transcriptional ArsR family regulator